MLLTLAFRSEWDTLPLVRAALAAGKTVVLPRVDIGARMLELHAIRDPVADIAPGYQGIPEPRSALPDPSRPRRSTGCWCRASPSTLPAAAWATAAASTTGCCRCFAPGTARVAGAFDLQIVPHVPAAPHDLAVHAIVTETRTIPAAGE